MKLHTQILLGLVVGAALGILVNLTLGAEHVAVEVANKYVAGPIGQIFLRMLFMVVMPLVFASIALGVAGIGDLRRVGRIGGKTLAYFAVSTAAAALFALVLSAVVRPGEQVPRDVRERLMELYAHDASGRVEASQTNGFGIDTFVNIVTRNPIKSAVDGDMLGVIFFGVMFGAAITLVPKSKGELLIKWLDALNEVVVKIIEIAMKLAPFGVAGLIFGVTSRFGFSLLVSLGAYVIVVIVALLGHSLITNVAIIRFLIGMSPVLFFSRIRESLITAFTTSSSNATLPTNLAVGEKNLGLPPTIAGFVYPLGATMCMNGTAIFEGCTVIFLCQAFGVQLDPGQMAVVIVMCVITAIGAAGVPGGSIPLLVGILAMMGVPGEGIAIVLGVDRLLDMARTTVNNLGDHCAAAWVAKSEGVWTAKNVPDKPGLEAKLNESPDWPKAMHGADVDEDAAKAASEGER